MSLYLFLPSLFILLSLQPLGVARVAMMVLL